MCIVYIKMSEKSFEEQICRFVYIFTFKYLRLWKVAKTEQSSSVFSKYSLLLTSYIITMMYLSKLSIYAIL